MSDQASDRPAVLFDFGGVLTTSVAASFRAFERAEGLPKGTVFQMIARAYTHAEEDHPISRFERGEATNEQFEQLLLDELADMGHEVEPGDLLRRLFTRYEPVDEMWQLVAACREAGALTGLLSNSWGTDGYPEDLIAEHFDDRVISGEVGLRKPDLAIFELAAERLGVDPADCAFVDDAEPNVDAAERLGMTGIHHTSVDETREALSAFLGADLG